MADWAMRVAQGVRLLAWTGAPFKDARATESVNVVVKSGIGYNGDRTR